MFSKVKRYLKYIFAHEPNPEKWVFIVGTTNSGTTLLHDILAQHPQIGSMPNEGQFYTDQLPIPKKMGLARLWTKHLNYFYMDENSNHNIKVKRIKKQWSLHYNDISRPILIEKTPVNSVRVKWLQKVFPNSYFIGIIRNGYAVSQGIKEKTGCTISDAAKQWLINNQVMLNDFNSLKNKTQVSYEDLSNDPYSTATEVFNFLGIEPLSDNIFSQSFSIHQNCSIIRNMNMDSIEKLTREEIEEINTIAGSLLNELKYPLPIK